MAGRLGTAIGTGQAIGACTGSGGQCADAIETGVGADGPERILHTGIGEAGALGGRKAEWSCLLNSRLGGHKDRLVRRYLIFVVVEAVAVYSLDLGSVC